MSEISDKSLIERLLNPSTREEAFRILVEQEGPRLYNLVRRIVQFHDDADDVMQNTFLKAWNAIEHFKGESALYTWLYRIAQNEAITYIKQRRNIDSLDDEDFILTPTSFIADDHFDGDQAQETLMQAISTLPPKQRQVFCMKYFEEQKYEDISNLVGTSIGALKASYHIAVEKITKFIKQKE